MLFDTYNPLVLFLFLHSSLELYIGTPASITTKVSSGSLSLLFLDLWCAPYWLRTTLSSFPNDIWYLLRTHLWMSPSRTQMNGNVYMLLVCPPCLHEILTHILNVQLLMFTHISDRFILWLFSFGASHHLTHSPFHLHPTTSFFPFVLMLNDSSTESAGSINESTGI